MPFITGGSGAGSAISITGGAGVTATKAGDVYTVGADASGIIQLLEAQTGNDRLDPSALDGISSITSGTTLPTDPEVNHLHFFPEDVLSGGVIGVDLSSGGSGYSAATTTVTFSDAPAGRITATGTAAISGGVINSIFITNNGSGYTSAPTITITDTGSGSGASATARVSPDLGWLGLDNNFSGNAFAGDAALYNGTNWIRISDLPPPYNTDIVPRGILGTEYPDAIYVLFDDHVHAWGNPISVDVIYEPQGANISLGSIFPASDTGGSMSAITLNSTQKSNMAADTSSTDTFKIIELRYVYFAFTYRQDIPFLVNNSNFEHGHDLPSAIVEATLRKSFVLSNYSYQGSGAGSISRAVNDDITLRLKEEDQQYGPSLSSFVGQRVTITVGNSSFYATVGTVTRQSDGIYTFPLHNRQGNFSVGGTPSSTITFASPLAYKSDIPDASLNGVTITKGLFTQSLFDTIQAGHNIQFITVSTLSALTTGLTSQASSNNALLIEFTADVSGTISGTAHTYVDGDIAYVPPQSSTVEKLFNIDSGSGLSTEDRAKFDRYANNPRGNPAFTSEDYVFLDNYTYQVYNAVSYGGNSIDAGEVMFAILSGTIRPILIHLTDNDATEVADLLSASTSNEAQITFRQSSNRAVVLVGNIVALTERTGNIYQIRVTQTSTGTVADGDDLIVEIRSSIATRSELDTVSGRVDGVVGRVDEIVSYHPDDDDESLNRRLHILEQKTEELDLIEHTNWVNTSRTGIVNSFTVTNAGSGYTARPTVTVSAPPSGVTARGQANLNAIGTINITAAGAGYITAPIVTIADSPTGGTTATATAEITNGAVTAITVTNAGTGYNNIPAVTLTAPPAGGTQATATAVRDAIGTITILDSGSGYIAVPTVTLADPPSGTTATATANTDLLVGQFALIDSDSELSSSDITGASYDATTLFSGDGDRIVLLRIVSGRDINQTRISRLDISNDPLDPFFGTFIYVLSAESNSVNYDYYVYGGAQPMSNGERLQVQRSTQTIITEYDGQIRTDLTAATWAREGDTTLVPDSKLSANALQVVRMHTISGDSLPISLTFTPGAVGNTVTVFAQFELDIGTRHTATVNLTKGSDTLDTHDWRNPNNQRVLHLTGTLHALDTITESGEVSYTVTFSAVNSGGNPTTGTTLDEVKITAIEVGPYNTSGSVVGGSSGGSTGGGAREITLAVYQYGVTGQPVPAVPNFVYAGGSLISSGDWSADYPTVLDPTRPLYRILLTALELNPNNAWIVTHGPPEVITHGYDVRFSPTPDGDGHADYNAFNDNYVSFRVKSFGRDVWTAWVPIGDGGNARDWQQITGITASNSSWTFNVTPVRSLSAYDDLAIRATYYGAGYSFINQQWVTYRVGDIYMTEHNRTTYDAGRTMFLRMDQNGIRLGKTNLTANQSHPDNGYSFFLNFRRSATDASQLGSVYMWGISNRSYNVTFFLR